MDLLKLLEKNWVTLALLAGTVAIIVMMWNSSAENASENNNAVPTGVEESTDEQEIHTTEDEGEPEMPFHEHVHPRDIEIMRGSSLTNNIDASAAANPDGFAPDCDAAPLA